MDESLLERADAFMTTAIEEGIAKLRQNKQQTRPLEFDGFCTCGEEVPEARVAAGYYNCVPCQTRLERFGKRRG